MNDDRHELISAYLDGEATPDERARVERLLAEDDDARRLHDELRALSATLQSLPRERLDEAFADQVLRRAERTVLTQGAPRDDHHSGGGGLGRAWSFPFGRSARGWAWAAMAIAAAVLVMIFNPDREAEVARNAPQPPPQAEVRPPQGEMRAPRNEGAENEGARPNESIESPAATRPPDRADNQQTEAAPEVAQLRAPAEPARVRQAAPAAAAMKAEPAEPRPEAMVEESAPLKVAPLRAAPKMMMRKAAPLRTMAADAAAAGPGIADAADAELARQIGQLGREGVLVVQLDVSRQAAAGRALEELFAQESIAVEKKPPLPLGELARRTASNQSRPKVGAPPEPADERPAPQALAARANAEPAAEGAPRDLRLMYVEATPEAVEATLAALAAKPAEFPVIEVEPARDAPRQQALLAYRRDRAGVNLGRRAPAAAPRAQRLMIAPAEPSGAKPKAAAKRQGQGHPTGRARRVRVESGARPKGGAAGFAQAGQAAPPQAAESMRVLFVLRVLPEKKQSEPAEKP